MSLGAGRTLKQVWRDRPSEPDPLTLLPPNALSIAISSDGLFTLSEQHQIADNIPGGRLAIIDSPEGA
jgi:homoserine O-acetyltransferase/O-succinyltransferase